jgi:hypothetical protein
MIRRIAGLLFSIFWVVLQNPVLHAEEARMAAYRDLLEHSGFPENDETRRLLSDAIIAPAYPAVETLFKINRQYSDDRFVQFEVRKAARDWYLIFRNQRGDVPYETYPLWGRGTWIIKKDLLTGSYLQAKIFLQDDEFSFVRIFPDGKSRSRLDVHMYGRQLGEAVIIPVAFEELMLAPFAHIVTLTDRSVDWAVIFPNPDSRGFRNVENMVRLLYPHSSLITEFADGAISGEGLNVHIDSGEFINAGDQTGYGKNLEPGQTGLNCSGYVKWVADGLYSAWTGKPGARYLPVEELRRPTLRDNRNPWNDARSATDRDARSKLDVLLRDTWFGLDWNRNLARIVEAARLGRALNPDEIRVLDTGELAGIPYQRDLGYNLDDLPSALFQLAAKRPGSIYLAAVNSRFVPEPTEAEPKPVPLHQYWHVSIMAPWFSDGSDGRERGSFHVAVLDVGDVSESLVANPVNGLTPRYPEKIKARAVQYARLGRDDKGVALVPEVMIHLSRVDVPRDFKPSPLAEAF